MARLEFVCAGSALYYALRSWYDALQRRYDALAQIRTTLGIVWRVSEKEWSPWAAIWRAFEKSRAFGDWYGVRHNGIACLSIGMTALRADMRRPVGRIAAE